MASSIVRMLNRNRVVRFLSFARPAMMSSSSANSSASLTKTSPPWLMLPSDNLAYKFYNIPEKRVESFELPEFDDEDDAVLVGSSHGWLAFFNRRNNHVFLTNPISGRRLNLPPFDPLPNLEVTVKKTTNKVMLPCTPPVSKLILSHSPEDDDCRAMVSFGPGDSLAFCSPAHSAPHWTPIGDLLFPERYYVDVNKDADNHDYFYHGRPYEDFVYCNRRKLFTCISQFWIDLDVWVPGRQFEAYYYPVEPSNETHLEDWDLHVDPPTSRVCYGLSRLQIKGDKCSWITKNKKLLRSCTQIPYLVFFDNSKNNQPFIVIRFVMNDEKTVGFSVLKVDYRQKNLLGDGLRFVESLDGLAVFVGMNHTFVVSNAAESGLEPNSIYFTDATKTRLTPSTYHGDVGIFDYGTKTVSPIPRPFSDYFSRDDKTLSRPIWFTPAGHS